MPAAAYWLPASDETPLYTRHWPSATAVGAVMLSTAWPSTPVATSVSPPR